MKESKLTIDINKSVAEVFAFAIDPNHSPKWIDSFAEEVTSTWPVALGTVYRNRGYSGGWNNYTVTAFEANKVFELTAEDGSYSVHYTFEEVGPNVTCLHYHERVMRGELDAPLEMATLEKLKVVVEGVK